MTKLGPVKDLMMETVVKKRVSNVVSSLKQVSDTPRLFRRTNRPSPTSHQPYVENALNLVSGIVGVAENLPGDDVRLLSKNTFTAVTQE